MADLAYSGVYATNGIRARLRLVTTHHEMGSIRQAARDHLLPLTLAVQSNFMMANHEERARRTGSFLRISFVISFVPAGPTCVPAGGWLAIFRIDLSVAEERGRDVRGTCDYADELYARLFSRTEIARNRDSRWVLPYFI